MSIFAAVSFLAKFQGDHNEKISIWFERNVSWCGTDVCVDAWGSEGG